MSRNLTLDMPEPVFEAIQRAAADAGITPTQWILDLLVQQLPRAEGRPFDPRTPEEKQRAIDNFRALCGSVRLSDPTGSDNDRIDADLAREYADTHDEEP
jgi:hypothetical protein